MMCSYRQESGTLVRNICSDWYIWLAKMDCPLRSQLESVYYKAESSIPIITYYVPDLSVLNSTFVARNYIWKYDECHFICESYQIIIVPDRKCLHFNSVQKKLNFGIQYKTLP